MFYNLKTFLIVLRSNNTQSHDKQRLKYKYFMADASHEALIINLTLFSSIAKYVTTP